MGMGRERMVMLEDLRVEIAQLQKILHMDVGVYVFVFS